MLLGDSFGKHDQGCFTIRRGVCGALVYRSLLSKFVLLTTIAGIPYRVWTQTANLSINWKRSDILLAVAVSFWPTPPHFTMHVWMSMEKTLSDKNCGLQFLRLYCWASHRFCPSSATYFCLSTSSDTQSRWKCLILLENDQVCLHFLVSWSSLGALPIDLACATQACGSALITQ